LFEGFVFAAGDGGFFLLGAEVGGKQIAGGVGAGVLGEVDEIDGRAALFVELGDFFLELGGGVFEFERDVTLVGLDEHGERQNLPNSGQTHDAVTRTQRAKDTADSRGAAKQRRGIPEASG